MHLKEMNKHAMIKDLIYRQDFDHPFSFHNQALH